MRPSIKKGLGFGLTSGIITTLGLIIGLYASTRSLLAIIGGILVIALSDSLSDALGMHISEEMDHKKSKKEVWEATFSTLIFKLIFALTFVVPFLLLSIKAAIVVSIFWGMLLITIASYSVGKPRGEPYWMIFEHLGIAVFVIAASYYVGILVRSLVG